MKSVWKALFTLFALGVMTVGCEQNLTSPTPVGSVRVDNVAGVGVSAGSQIGSVATQDCGNPNDWIPDDSALQGCFDQGGEILLDLGSPGYIVNGLDGDNRRGVWLIRNGTRLSSSKAPLKATIIAGRDLFGHILSTPPGLGVDGFSIENISFNGMVDEIGDDGQPYRRLRDDCFDPGGNPGNLALRGNGFRFNNNESLYAMCGSGFGLAGSNFEVQNNLIAHNGRDRFSNYRGVPWSDGMTVISCDHGYIGHNTLTDNTDIDLVIGGGHGCVVEINTIFHLRKYGFTGLNVGNFDGGGDHSGSEFRGNTVYSEAPNKLSIGILVGAHPWTSKVDVENAGRVVGNTSYGNVMNLVVDGVHGGEVTGNNMYDPRGDQGLGVCRDSLNYAVYPPHVSNTVLQPDWAEYQYDGDVGCGFYNQIVRMVHSPNWP